MSVFSKPIVVDEVFGNYEVIGHVNDLSVVLSEDGTKYYAPLDENQQPVGTCVDNSMLHPLDELPVAIRNHILRDF